MSETGSGGIRQLRERLMWLARVSDTGLTFGASGRWVRELSALGHAEAWWDQDRWAAAPPVIVRLPAADGTAVVVGARSAGLHEQLQDSDISFQVYEAEPADGELWMPSYWFIQFDDVVVLRDVAARTGARYVGCAATRLAAQLPKVSLGPPAPPPAAPVSYLERLEASGRFVRVPDRPRLDGLYRMRANHRLVHLYRHGGDWFHCDRANGTFLELARRRTPVLRWRSEGQRGRMLIGSLFMDEGVPLPALQARTLTLCSGQAPQLSRAAGTTTYGNVPRAIANQVAESLHQTIDEIP
jgi:hypothetical protein